MTSWATSKQQKKPTLGSLSTATAVGEEATKKSQSRQCKPRAPVLTAVKITTGSEVKDHQDTQGTQSLGT